MWLITGGRLFLFYDRALRPTRSAFTSAAERKWPDVLHTLSP
jgi:hypothetical protein